MTFWQENYSFIKDVYDKRTEKLVEIMDKTDKAMKEVKADKIYTSAQFKKVKENFAALAKNLEQPETKEWLASTKETLMTDKTSKEVDEESKKLAGLLKRFDEMAPAIADTRNVVACLWKSYEFTDEVAPVLEWLEENRSKSTRPVNTNCASQTEEHIEKQEKTLDQLDKKKRPVTDLLTKGDKIMSDPKAPQFLKGHLDKLKAIWDECNVEGDKRLSALKENLSAWERYETTRDILSGKLDNADAEFSKTKKVFDLVQGPQTQATRLQTAASLRKDLEDTFKTVSDANDILQRMLTQDKKAELTDEVEGLRARMKVLDSMDEKLKNLDDFNKRLVEYDKKLKEMEEWLVNGRKRMDELMNPPAPMQPEEKVLATMELQDDIKKQQEAYAKQMEEWENLKPTEDGEDTSEAKKLADPPEAPKNGRGRGKTKPPPPPPPAEEPKKVGSQALVARMEAVKGTQGKLMDEVAAEGEKFGEDVKHLADFTGGIKKIEPWLTSAEAKKGAGLGKPTNLGQAEERLAATKKWKEESDSMAALLETSNASAQKMTKHEEADVKYDAFKKRLAVIDETAKDWIAKLESMVEVWKKQAETAAKVSAAIAAGPDSAPSEMKLEDLEKHLESIKQAFIEKQRMMAEMEKTGGGAPAPAAAPAAAPAPEAPKEEPKA